MASFQGRRAKDEDVACRSAAHGSCSLSDLQLAGLVPDACSVTHAEVHTGSAQPMQTCLAAASCTSLQQRRLCRCRLATAQPTYDITSQQQPTGLLLYCNTYCAATTQLTAWRSNHGAAACSARLVRSCCSCSSCVFRPTCIAESCRPSCLGLLHIPSLPPTLLQPPPPKNTNPPAAPQPAILTSTQPPWQQIERTASRLATAIPRMGWVPPASLLHGRSATAACWPVR
jgi:hypothetical protein